MPTTLEQVKAWISNLSLPTIWGTSGEQHDSHVLTYQADLARKERMNQLLILGLVAVGALIVARKLKK